VIVVDVGDDHDDFVEHATSEVRRVHGRKGRQHAIGGKKATDATNARGASVVPRVKGSAEAAVQPDAAFSAMFRNKPRKIWPQPERAFAPSTPKPHNAGTGVQTTGAVVTGGRDGVGYAHVAVVRGKAERAALRGFGCSDCQKVCHCCPCRPCAHHSTGKCFDFCSMCAAS
jgi:hypothetical protein